ncbi:MAG: TetR/AcrR family transcriptional regulator [Actinomycetes bacterium]
MEAEVPVPLPDPLADLQPTARRIVEVARRLLIEKGYPALSLENIANACGLNKTAIRYYFGNKAGLMEAVVDTWVHENIGLVLPGFTARPAKGRLHAFRVAKQQMSENTEVYLAFLELLPAILRDARHSERITELYEWAMEMYSHILGADLPDLSAQEMRGFTQLIIAVVDGLAVQHAINPEKFRTGEAYDMLESIIDTWMTARRTAGAPAAASDAGAPPGAD